MRVFETNVGIRTGTWLLFVANALPILGLLAFDWQPFQALFVYWLQIGATLLGYFAVVLFGQRESKPEQKEGGSYPGPVPLPVPDLSLQPISAIPPLRLRNVRYVPAAVPLVALVWIFLSRAFMDFTNTGVLIEGRPEAESMIGYVLVSYTPEGLAVAAVASSIHLFTIGRDFLYRGLVDRYSAAMLMEIPVRIAGVWFVVLLFLVPAYVGTTVLDVGQSVVGWGFFVPLLGAKLAIDRASLRARYVPNPDWFTGLFVPNDRETDDESRAETTAAGVAN